MPSESSTSNSARYASWVARSSGCRRRAIRSPHVLLRARRCCRTRGPPFRCTDSAARRAVRCAGRAHGIARFRRRRRPARCRRRAASSAPGRPASRARHRPASVPPRPLAIRRAMPRQRQCTPHPTRRETRARIHRHDHAHRAATRRAAHGSSGRAAVRGRRPRALRLIAMRPARRRLPAHDGRGGGRQGTRAPFGVDWMHGHFDFLTMRRRPRNLAACAALRHADAARFVRRAAVDGQHLPVT